MTKSSSHLCATEVKVATQRTYTTLGPLARLKGLNSYASDIGLACLVYPDIASRDMESQKSLGHVTRMALEQSPWSPRCGGSTWRRPKKGKDKMALERPRHCSSRGDGPSSLCLPQRPGNPDQPAGDGEFPLSSPAGHTYSRLSMLSSSGDESQMTTAYSRQWSSRTSWESEMELRDINEYSTTSLATTISALQRFFQEPVVGVILAIQYFSLVVVLCFIGFNEPGMFDR